jgi:antitoxin CptB
MMPSEKNGLPYFPGEITYIRWKCRRGMLELDELLQYFFDHYFLQLPAEQQRSFEELLNCPDPELFSWLMGTAQPSQPEWVLLVQKIRVAKQGTK